MIIILSIDYLFNLPLMIIDVSESAIDEGVEKIYVLEKPYVLLLILFIGPFFETFFYQYTIIKVIRLLIADSYKNFLPSVLTSAIVFGSHHYYNFYYFLSAFIGGLIWAIAFYISIYRKEPAFLVVLAIHIIWNLISYLSHS